MEKYLNLINFQVIEIFNKNKKVNKSFCLILHFSIERFANAILFRLEFVDVENVCFFGAAKF